tara:strand:- start:245 stop:1861 length:1617 start_codon:yes stop_codon:yes gene_type:complete
MANGAPTVSNGLVISGVTTTSDIKVGTGATLNVYGGATFSGIVTATSFVGDGSNLSNITTTTINNNADNRVITGSGTANTLNGESGLVYNGYNLAISGTGQQQLNLGSTNAGGVAIILDGDSNGDAAGGDYSIIRHNTDGDLEFFARSPAGATNTIFRQGTSEKVRIDASGNMNVTGILTATNLVSNQPSSHKNYIMNGKAMVFQRVLPGSMVTINNGNNTYCMDRWYGRGEGSKGVFTFHQHDIQSQGQAAHAALRVNVTTTSTPSTNDVYKVAQRIEGRNIDGLGFGTSAAKTITLSFLTKSSVTGTHGGSIMNGAQNRAYPFTYTINSADTWEQKSITIPGDTSGTWSSGNDVGLEVNFDMGTAEDTYRRPAGSWYAGRAEGADGTVQLITQSGGNWYATKIQLEEGNVATPFEHIPYPDELLRCKRYSFILGGGDTETYTTLLMGIQSHSTLCKAHVQFPVDMRSKDVTFSFSNLTLDDDLVGYSNGRISSVNSENAGKSSATLIFNTASMNNVNATRILTDAAGGYIFCDCEL